LFGEYDVFLADDRVITLLPKILGKVFYKSGSKRPIPISLEGRRQDTDEQGNKRRKLSEGGTKVVKDEVKPASIARDIERTLSSALVHLAPSTTTAVKVGIASMTAEHVQENITAVVSDMVERYVPQKWRNLRAVHIKGQVPFQPHFPFAESNFKYVNDAFTTSLIVALLGFFESCVAAKSLGNAPGKVEKKTKTKSDGTVEEVHESDGIVGMFASSNRELVALGVANLIGGVDEEVEEAPETAGLLAEPAGDTPSPGDRLEDDMLADTGSR
jgi:hypothetical protein